MLSTLPVPKTVRDVQAFLDFINLYAEFIPISTHLKAPLYNLTIGKKGINKVSLNVDEPAIFHRLKRALCFDPQLAHPDFSKQFVVHINASKFAVGDMLLQLSDDIIERPIVFFVKKLLSPKQNYSTFERECLALVSAVTHFLVYLVARPFVLRIDHTTLTWLFSKDPIASARNWIETLLEYPIVVEDIKGTENTIADVLSHFKSNAVDQILPPELANGIISYKCPVSDTDRLELRTYLLNELCADTTIARVLRCIDADCKPNADQIELNLSLQQYLDV